MADNNDKKIANFGNFFTLYPPYDSPRPTYFIEKTEVKKGRNMKENPVFRNTRVYI